MEKAVSSTAVSGRAVQNRDLMRHSDLKSTMAWRWVSRIDELPEGATRYVSFARTRRSCNSRANASSAIGLPFYASSYSFSDYPPVRVALSGIWHGSEGAACCEGTPRERLNLLGGALFLGVAGL